MKSWMRSLLALAVLAAGATANLSCSVNDYCLHCATDDAGNDGGSGSNDDGGMDDDAEIDAGCVPTGLEECDGKDNDCNGLVDDGVLPQVGQLCAVQTGECAGGVNQCVNGKIECSKKASAEICDTLDNNCNGEPDEGNPGGGGKCGTEMGECVAGQLQCNKVTGDIDCIGAVGGSSELCDAKDNDCDGNFDEGLTNLGMCGPPANVGECVRGTLVCQAGGQVCMGATFAKFETCNSKDDDCDNKTDEIFNLQTDPNNCGQCGMKCLPAARTCSNSTATCTSDAQCGAGTCIINSQPRCQTGGCGFTCNAGQYNDDGMAANGCEYRCFATGAEECDGADNDCDGDVDEGVTPPAICLSGGECGTSAPTATCSGAGGWTCTYPGTVQFPETLCDGKNNDCDANIDEAQPNLGGTCSEVPETACSDQVDDDNDGFVNDGCPVMGTAETAGDCNDIDDDDTDGRPNDGCPAKEERGVCKSTGTYQCNPQNLNGPAKCTITNPGDTPDANETCDAKDNDCDGKTDEGGASGDLTGQDWVDIGGGKEMMKYEASLPDATTTDQGSAPASNPLDTTSFACSRPGVKPWANIKYGDAVAACAKIGARLCTEVEWHRACSNITDVTYPLAAPTGGSFIEAESYKTAQYAGGAETACTGNSDDDNDGFVNDGCPVVGTDAETNCTNSTSDGESDGSVNDGCPAIGPHSWVEDYTSGFSGISNVEATPNLGATFTAANAVAGAPYVEFEVTLGGSSNNWHVWVKTFANNANNDSIYVGVGGGTPVATTTFPAASFNSWQWVDAALPGTLSGTQTIRVYMGDDGAKIDKLYIIAGTTTAGAIAGLDSIASKGGKWAFASNQNTYNGTTCNGDDLDTSAAAGDQDDILITGSLPSCKSNIGTGVFDLSGNVKEWTLRHAPGENPIRGGASNNTGEGISCPLNFTLADDQFFFPNIGFRCCR